MLFSKKEAFDDNFAHHICLLEQALRSGNMYNLQLHYHTLMQVVAI